MPVAIPNSEIDDSGRTNLQIILNELLELTEIEKNLSTASGWNRKEHLRNKRPWISIDPTIEETILLYRNEGWKKTSAQVSLVWKWKVWDKNNEKRTPNPDDALGSFDLI